MKKQTIYIGLGSILCIGILSWLVLMLLDKEDIRQLDQENVVESSIQEEFKGPIIVEEKVIDKFNQEVDSLETANDAKRAAAVTIDVFTSSTMYRTDEKYPTQRLKEIEFTLNSVKPYMEPEDYNRFKDEMYYRYEYSMVFRDVDEDNNFASSVISKSITQEETLEAFYYMKAETEKTLNEWNSFQNVPVVFRDSHDLLKTEFEIHLMSYIQLIEGLETGNRNMAFKAIQQIKANNSAEPMFRDISVEVFENAKNDIYNKK